MASEIFINIKDLPEITEPTNGEYLLIETSTGTHIIDFANFVIPTANTVITATVEQNTTAILTLSSDYTSADATLSANIDTANTNYQNLSTMFDELSSTLDNSNTSISNLSSQIEEAFQNIDSLTRSLEDVPNQIYIGKAQITIPIGSSQGAAGLNPLPTITLAESDIMITPANKYATRQNAYVTSVSNGVVNIRAGFVKYYANVATLSTATLLLQQILQQRKMQFTM